MAEPGKGVTQSEFQGQDLQGQLWALDTGLLEYGDLVAATERFHQIDCSTAPTAEVAGLAARYWLSLAHKGHGAGGSARGSYANCERAQRILQEFIARHPNNADLTQLLQQIHQARWTYDD